VDEHVERYLRLGLRVGRHVDGIVDAYYGPAHLADEVDAAPPVEPRELVGEAESLLGVVEDGWLRDQVAGLHTYARVLAGAAMPYADEVEGCYGVRPRHTDESVFAAAHERLEELLPGEGSIGERFQRWEESTRVPPERVEDVLAAVMEEARAQTRALVELPEGEGVDLEIVHDKPWLAYCGYQGRLRSRIEVNVDLPQSAIAVLHLALHETYAGHHTEACVKEQHLVRERGVLEQTLFMVPTPQSLLAEGIAELAPELLLAGEGGAALAAIVRDAGAEFDLAHSLAIGRAREPCGWAAVNAALMLYEADATDAEAQAYIERWSLARPEEGEHAVRFLREPTSRSYVLTYSAGLELCRAYVGGDVARFRRLLTDQVRVRDLVAPAQNG
jgi:hypothetical protein